ncbi:MAG: hypothetical protein COB59_09915 [Rhodospirillaceae bacterium]|nr:MAG: hypothetical protein COB59_09915 [Rhodospirillaceae bacterium]
MKVATVFKIIGALAVLAIAAVVATIGILQSIDFNNFKAEVEAMAAEATGRDVTIEGDLDLVLSLTPSLNMSGVRLGNAEWGVKKPMMVLQNLKAKVDLQSLLSGKLNVDYFVIDGLTLILQTDGKGRANWEFEGQEADVAATKSSTGLDIVPQVQDIRLNNIDLTYIDGASKRRFHVLLDKINVQAETYDSPMAIQMQATYNAVILNVNSNLGSLKHLIGKEGKVFPVDLDIQAKGLSLNVKGGVEQPSAGMTVNARIQANVSNMSTLSKLAETDLSALQNIKAGFDVFGSGTRYSLSAIDVLVDGTDLSGKLDIDLTNRRPRLSGTLSSQMVRVPETSPKTKKSEKIFTTDPLEFDALHLVDLDVSYAAKLISLKPLLLSNLKAQVKLNKGRLDIKTFSVNLGGGALLGAVKVDGASKKPKLYANLKIQNLDVGHLVEVFDFGDLLDLKLDGKVNVQASNASSTRALVSSLNGDIEFSAKNGEIKDKAIEGLGVTVISCLVGRLPIENGDVVAKTVVLGTPAFDATVTGNIDLPGERLHLTISPQAKTTSLSSFAVPVRLKGSLKEPYIGLDAGEVVAGTVGNVLKAPAGLVVDVLRAVTKTKYKDACAEALKKAKEPSSRQNTPEKKPEKKPEPKKDPPSKKLKSTGDPVKDLGNIYEGLFGK